MADKFIEGSFKTLYSENGHFGLQCDYTIEQDYGANQSKITLEVYLLFVNMHLGSRLLHIFIGTEEKEFKTAGIEITSSGQTRKLLATHSRTINHDADGNFPKEELVKDKLRLLIQFDYNDTYNKITYSCISTTSEVEIPKIPTTTLQINASDGVTITVNRIYSRCNGAKTGKIENGTKLYQDETLYIYFKSNPGYSDPEGIVNNSAFNSGSSFTVTNGFLQNNTYVTVAATAESILSTITATNANIGSKSKITITKKNNDYWHSIFYLLNGANKTGYITRDGGTSTTEVKFQDESVEFTIPEDFGKEMPSAKEIECFVCVTTYRSKTDEKSLGTNKCYFYVSATNPPVVNGAIKDINPTTKELTGDETVLIRYKSKALATIDAEAQNYAFIARKYINGTEVINNDELTFDEVSNTSFAFKAIDSRGYETEKVVTPKIVEYIQLTINPIITRPEPTGDKLEMRFSGDYYNDSFGVYSNTLKIKYRYRESTSSTWSKWTTVQSEKYLIGKKKYSTESAFSLGENFGYTKSYEFEVEAVDGINNKPLSTVTKKVTVTRGVPVFDWGEDDFEFHVDVKISNKNLQISDGYLQIGDTTITETQLQSLLALL